MAWRCQCVLKQIDRETPKDKALHLIVDNYATPKLDVATWAGGGALHKHAATFITNNKSDSNT